MFVLIQKILVIALMDFFSHYWSLLHHGFQSLWISSWIFHDLTHFGGGGLFHKDGSILFFATNQ